MSATSSESGWPSAGRAEVSATKPSEVKSPLDGNGHDAVWQCCMGSRGAARKRDKRLRLEIVEIEPELFLSISRIEGRGAGNCGDGQKRQCHLGTVREDDGQAIPGPDPKRAETSGKAIDLATQRWLYQARRRRRTTRQVPCPRPASKNEPIVFIRSKVVSPGEGMCNRRWSHWKSSRWQVGASR